MIRCHVCKKKRSGKFIIRDEPVCYECAQSFIEYTLEAVPKLRKIADDADFNFPKGEDSWGARELIEKLDKGLESIEKILGLP